MPWRPGGRIAGRGGANREGAPFGVVCLLALFPQNVYANAIEYPRHR